MRILNVALLSIVLGTPACTAHGEDRATVHVVDLVEQLGSDDWRERESAEKCLSELSHVVLEEVKKAVADSADFEVRTRGKRVVKLLLVKAHEAYQRSIPGLMEKLKTLGGAISFVGGEPVLFGNDPCNYGDACVRLAEFGERAIPALETLYKTGHWIHRKRAICSLGRMDMDSAMKIVIHALNDQSLSVVDQAIRSLGRHRKVEHIALLEPFLRTGDSRFYVALEAVERIGGKPAVDALLKYLSSTDKCRRGWIAAALGRLGDMRAILPIQEMLEKDRWFQVSANHKEEIALRQLQELHKTAEEDMAKSIR